jgi:hypothetical protein
MTADQPALTDDLICPCGHSINHHDLSGCDAYIRPSIGGSPTCCTRTPNDIVAARVESLAAENAALVAVHREVMSEHVERIASDLLLTDALTGNDEGTSTHYTVHADDVPYLVRTVLDLAEQVHAERIADLSATIEAIQQMVKDRL